MPSAPLRFLPRPVGAAAGGANLVLVVVLLVVVEEEKVAVEVVVMVVVVVAAAAVPELERERGEGSRAAVGGRGNLAAPCRPGEGRLPA